MEMVRTIAIASALVCALVVPGTAAAALSPSDYKNASKFCKALKADMGSTPFKQTYGTNENRSNAHGKCVSKHARTLDKVHASAVSQCRTERDADAAAFTQKYGTGKKGKNAFGRCVSKQSKELADEKQDEIVDAVKTCRTERAADRAAFAEKYGTNHNNRNAFGKCVSHEAASNA
jgi:erythromycin esterase-like protein